LWVHRLGDGDGTFEQPVLPDACMDVVVAGDDLVVSGPATRTTTVSLRPGAVGVGIRFRPGAAPAVVGVSAAELRDLGVSVGDLWGRSGAALADQVLDVDAADWAGRLRVIADGLVERLQRRDDGGPDPVGVGIAPLLDEQPGRPVAALAEDVGLSERQLRRRVEDAVGYSPRVLARILRFQRFLAAARAAGPGRHLARLAADAGYADQAHLTRESKELAGLPPAALLRWEAERLAG
jgi:AraC-like DNA-binding protein